MAGLPLIVALDFSSRKEAEYFLTSFENEPIYVKVGMELFYKEGPDIVLSLKEAGHSIFLDLKLHDIPVTVKRAMTQLAGLGADLVNVHALGGKEMMSAALEGLDKGTKTGERRPDCIAVTQLTSTSKAMVQQEMAVTMPLEEHVLHLCAQTEGSGLDGVVCSALEVPEIRRRFPSFMTVTPGIRRSDDEAGGQVRIVTPAEARKNGSSAIVVGRGITRAQDPFAAYREYEKEWRQL